MRRRDEFIVWTRGDQWFIGTTTCVLLLVLLVIAATGRGTRRCILDGDVHAIAPAAEISGRLADGDLAGVGADSRHW